MRALAAALAAAFCFTLPAFAADAPAPKAKSTTNRMDPAKGAFHQVHAKKLKLACNTCHDAKAGDLLVVQKTTPGHVTANREVCLACHQEPARPAWYGAAR